MADPRELIQAWLDGELDHQRASELGDWIAQHDANAREFVRASMVHYTIREHLVGQYNVEYAIADNHDPDDSGVLAGILADDTPAAAADAPEVPGLARRPLPDHDQPLASQEPRIEKLLEFGPLRVVRRPGMQRERPVMKRVRHLGWAAVIALLAGLAVIFMQPLPQGQHSGPLARVTAMSAAEWASPNGQEAAGYEVGSVLEQGTFELTSGFVELEMVNGTVVVLEAPLDFELRRHDVLRLERGRLVARAGDGAESFTVVTPTASVTDLGTEFGVVVDADGAMSTSVFEGLVQFMAADGPQEAGRGALQVEANYTASVRRGGEVTVEQSANRPELASRYRRMMPESEYDAMVLNAEPIAYWRFGDLENRVVPNVAGHAYAAHLQGTGELAVVEYGQGRAVRLPGEQMYFTAADLAPALEGQPAYTFEVLVQPEDIHHGNIFSLLQRQGTEERLTAMILEFADEHTFERYARRLRFGHRTPPQTRAADGTEIISDPPYAAGQWLHVVAVKDRQALHLYVNGKHVGTEPDPSPLAQRIDDIHIGAHRPDHEPQAHRFFKGLIASAAVYPRALSEEQIVDRHGILSNSLPLASPGDDTLSMDKEKGGPPL